MSVQPQVSTHLKRMAVLHNSTATVSVTFDGDDETLRVCVGFGELGVGGDGRIVFYCRLVSDKKAVRCPVSVSAFPTVSFR